MQWHRNSLRRIFLARNFGISLAFAMMLVVGYSDAAKAANVKPIDAAVVALVIFNYRFDSNLCSLPLDPRLDGIESYVMGFSPKLYLKGVQKGQAVLSESLRGLEKFKGVNPVEFLCVAAKETHNVYWQIIEKTWNTLQ